jgi:hypothetical protein
MRLAWLEAGSGWPQPGLSAKLARGVKSNMPIVKLSGFKGYLAQCQINFDLDVKCIHEIMAFFNFLFSHIYSKM